MYVLYDETAGKESEFSIDVVSLRNIKVLYIQYIREKGSAPVISLVVGASLLVWSFSLSLSLSRSILSQQQNTHRTQPRYSNW